MLTKEQIEKARKILKGELLSTQNVDIDSLCDLALSALTHNANEVKNRLVAWASWRYDENAEMVEPMLSLYEPVDRVQRKPLYTHPIPIPGSGVSGKLQEALSLWRVIYSSSGTGQTISARPAAFAAAKELDALLGGGAQQAQEDRGHG